MKKTRFFALILSVLLLASSWSLCSEWRARAWMRYVDTEDQDPPIKALHESPLNP